MGGVPRDIDSVFILRNCLILLAKNKFSRSESFFYVGIGRLIYLMLPHDLIRAELDIIRRV